MATAAGVQATMTMTYVSFALGFSGNAENK
jgi:hypothetical protein